jgi:hypothetical protein
MLLTISLHLKPKSLFIPQTAYFLSQKVIFLWSTVSKDIEIGQSSSVLCNSLTVLRIPQSVSRFSRRCGVLNISQHYRYAQPVTGISLISFLQIRHLSKPSASVNLRLPNVLFSSFRNTGRWTKSKPPVILSICMSFKLFLFFGLLCEMWWILSSFVHYVRSLLECVSEYLRYINNSRNMVSYIWLSLINLPLSSFAVNCKLLSQFIYLGSVLLYVSLNFPSLCHRLAFSVCWSEKTINLFANGRRR